jgi:hypothetical protein
MGRLKSERGQRYNQFDLSDAVPEDHLVRNIDAALDLPKKLRLFRAPANALTTQAAEQLEEAVIGRLAP